MINDPHSVLLKLVSHVCLFALPFSTLAQTTTQNKLQTRVSEKEVGKSADTPSLESQQRAFAISLVTSLADEARNYHDRALRPRVLARAADTLWDSDSDTARTLFRRAWEAAEKGDAEELTLKTPDGVPQMATELVTALRRSSGYDLRQDVLTLAARRDQKLGEEFLSKLKQDATDEPSRSKTGSESQTATVNSEAVSKRLNLANKLLDQGEIERALEFAAPALNQVNENSINFLSRLREKRSDFADQRFALLLTRAEFDPSSDANTVSGLSSYAFTPGIYVTFNADGSARWTQPEQSAAPLKPPNLPPMILNKFFQVAATILLRPPPSPDQDFTSSGRVGKYMVVKRLLPLFEKEAPDMAVALRSQLQALSDGPKSGLGGDTPLLTQGFQSDETPGSMLERIQDRLDHAKSSRERDLIYADAAAILASQGDGRAQEFAQKIEDSVRRAQVGQYVDFELVRLALREKKALNVIQLAASEQLTHPQRAWAYTQAARLLMDSERQRGLELLEEAANQARRIEPEDPNRARLLIGVATAFFTVDRVRAWEIMGEAVKAANNSEKFSGENVELHFPFATKSGLRITSAGGADFGLSGVLRFLAADDLYRSIDVAKSFKNDAPRAVAVLAIAGSLLQKVEKLTK
jgi:hypothetical protein